MQQQVNLALLSTWLLKDIHLLSSSTISNHSNHQAAVLPVGDFTSCSCPTQPNLLVVVASSQVPKVYWQYSTSEVLVLEYCPGIKINDAPALDAKGLDRQRLARLAVESYLQQILNHGFFHAGKDLAAP